MHGWHLFASHARLLTNKKDKDMKKTIKNFREYCGETLGALVVPVKNQMGLGVDEFFSELENVSKSYCGAAAGFGGFIWYTETVSFWRRNKAKIMAYADDMAESLCETTLDMVCGFGGFKDSFTSDEIGRALYGNYDEDLTQIYNGMAWFVLEELAYRYSDWEYENRN